MIDKHFSFVLSALSEFPETVTRTDVFATALQHGGSESARLIERTALTKPDIFLLHGLASSSDTDLLERLLHYALDPAFRDDTAAVLMERVWENPNGFLLYWRFIRENFGKVVKVLKDEDYGDEHLFETTLERVKGNVAWAPDNLEEVKTWLNVQMKPWAEDLCNLYPF
ncbi:glutamyl aminopeptidase [Elysia marginata]|uniref:Glutamyl aminopeptidase n=1 Tax=Elysia marginata TaxID=1093978 RepID=A0AAV4EL90_9GAST|nr:glutamyl aminopeptidase [Elysia marginata]